MSVLLVGILACSGSQAPTGGSGQSTSAEQCAALAKPAIDEALAGIAKHASCTTDDECVNVGVGSACFDVCTRAVNKGEVEAVNAELKEARCGGFTAAGCQVVPPPCAPPQPPVCRDGRCE